MPSRHRPPAASIYFRMPIERFSLRVRLLAVRTTRAMDAWCWLAPSQEHDGKHDDHDNNDCSEADKHGVTPLSLRRLAGRSCLIRLPRSPRLAWATFSPGDVVIRRLAGPAGARSAGTPDDAAPSPTGCWHQSGTSADKVLSDASASKECSGFTGGFPGGSRTCGTAGAQLLSSRVIARPGGSGRCSHTPISSH
jgi:hypothetical protein